ncbi:MAG: Soluble epoxide hydrolase [Myxococcota bacterium]|nr:Soluble epoxide hydrolase [Myxococcota bacterium]
MTSANGIRFHYVRKGDGPALFLLHGFPESWYSWRNQLDGLCGGFTVIAPDLRGYGLTDKPRGGYDIPNLAKDVRELARVLGHERIFLAGHDWGGALAWAVAGLYPEFVRKLAVLNCPHPLVMRKFLIRPRQMRKSWYMFFFQLPGLPERLIERDIRGWTARTFKGYAHRREVFTPEVLGHLANELSRPGTIRGGVNWYRAAFRSIANPPRIGPVRAPSLMLWGTRDPALGKEMADPHLYKGLADDYRVEWNENSGHWLQQEEPAWVNDRLQAWFGSGN